MDDSALFALFGVVFLVLAAVIEAQHRQRSPGRRWARASILVGGIGILELVLAALLRVV